MAEAGLIFIVIVEEQNLEFLGQENSKPQNSFIFIVVQQIECSLLGSKSTSGTELAAKSPQGKDTNDTANSQTSEE